ncbi:MAG: glycosyltransferase family 39 protein [bacterium]|nr:glycosyltransferase family 39 protein [bacterium]
MIPGYLLLDEAIWHLTIKNFADSGTFTIWNGYQEYPSREFMPGLTVLHDGRILSQYPYLYAILAFPFYRLMGVSGLFWLNALAFVAAIALCYAIAQILFHDRNLSLNACLILMLASYAWEYSQALYPHMFTTCLLMAAYYAFLKAFYAPAPNNAFCWAALAGLIAGIAMGVRLNTVFFFPTLFLPFLFVRPWRWREALAVVVGILPGLLALSITNYIKFDILFPLSYGGSLFGRKGRADAELRYVIEIGVLAIGGILLIWVLTRLYFMLPRKSHKLALLGSLLCCLGGAFFFPQFYRWANKAVTYAYQIAIDFRWRPQRVMNARILFRSSTGGIVFIEGLKKAFVQSCPYLPILFLPIVHICRRKKETQALALLLSTAAIFSAYYLYSGWHGDLGLNLRYLLPVLPFTSLLTAYGWRDLRRSISWSDRYLAFLLGEIGLILTGIYFFKFWPIPHNLLKQEFPHLSLPLYLAGLLFLLLLIREAATVRSERQHPKIGTWHERLSLVVLPALFVTMLWAGLVEFFYDYPLVRRKRHINQTLATKTRAVVEDHGILFTDYNIPFFSLHETSRIRVAFPGWDKYRDFRHLIAHTLSQGESVYGAFSERRWKSIEKKDLLRNYTVVPLFSFSPYRMQICQIIKQQRIENE